MVEPQLVRDFVSTGQVLFEYRDHAFLGEESREAAEAAWCADDQDLFWEMHDAIFNNQVEGPYDEGAFARERLDRIAETVGELDMGQWGQCMDDNKYQDQVEDDTQTSEQSGVQGTPTFLVNGQLLFGASYDELTQQIQQALGG